MCESYRNATTRFGIIWLQKFHGEIIKQNVYEPALPSQHCGVIPHYPSHKTTGMDPVSVQVQITNESARGDSVEEKHNIMEKLDSK